MNKKDKLFLEVKLSKRADREIQNRLKAAYKARLAEEKSSRFGFIRMFALSMASVFVLVIGMGGVGYHAVHSETIIKGDLLYSVKLSWEDYQLNSLPDGVDKSEYYLSLSDKRLAEANESFKRETGENWFLPTANAVDDGSVPSIQASVTAELLSESSRLLGLSLNEAGKIVDVKLKAPLLTRIKGEVNEYDQILKELGGDKFASALIQDKSLDLVRQEAADVAVKNHQFIEEYEDYIEEKFDRLKWDDVDEWDEIDDWDLWWEDLLEDEEEDDDDFGYDDDYFEDDYEWELEFFDWDDLEDWDIDDVEDFIEEVEEELEEGEFDLGDEEIEELEELLDDLEEEIEFLEEEDEWEDEELSDEEEVDELLEELDDLIEEIEEEDEEDWASEEEDYTEEEWEELEEWEDIYL